MYTIFNIATVINATFIQKGNDTAIEHLLIDSRRLLFPRASLFFAIAGKWTRPLHQPAPTTPTLAFLSI